ncbi:MAG TPA: hypothetical protein VH092_05090, partial [Urbifossiella sp.]|nr:hypothetical protein [Urbifossiella sp.]
MTRRFLFAAGLLATLAAAQADAGYFIVRIILEGGNGAGEGGAPGGIQPGGGPGRPPMIGPGGPRGPGGPMAGMPGPGRPGGPPPGGADAGMPGGAAKDDEHGPHDPTRSIFVIVPVTKSPDGKNQHFYPKLVPSARFNPSWPIILSHPFGTTNLLVDSTEIQLYPDFAQVPTGTKTRTTLVQSQYDDWKRNHKDDTQKLFNLMNTALGVGMVREAVAMADELLAAVQEKKAASPAVERFAAAYGPL